jgi:hypothetical protein
MNTVKNKPTMSRWVGGLFLIAYMALFLGIGLRFEAASRARQENAERNEWLPVTAHAAILDRNPFAGMLAAGKTT